MECIYFDKNSIVWEFPREIQDSLFFTGNNEMFNIYHKRLKNIYEKLCLKYIKIPTPFNILNLNNSKENINFYKEKIIHSRI